MMRDVKAEISDVHDYVKVFEWEMLIEPIPKCNLALV